MYLGSMYLLCGYTLAMAPKYKSKFRLAHHHVGKALGPINKMKRHTDVQTDVQSEMAVLMFL